MASSLGYIVDLHNNIFIHANPAGERNEENSRPYTQ
jgi:hypothetical protein